MLHLVLEGEEEAVIERANLLLGGRSPRERYGWRK
jgi:hypothetical protein